MILFLAAQDITRMEAGLLDSEGRLLSFQEFTVAPEGYLATTAEFLHDHLVSPEALEKIVVVSGPGSFTSTRIIVTIANALAFAKKLLVIGVENAARQGGEEMIRTSGAIWVKQKTEGFVTPVYDRPPHITIKKV
ncbi:MAG: hypothetical protein WC702_04015 [Patescibacteria group bacterium]|jgi:hypothetical protein